VLDFLFEAHIHKNSSQSYFLFFLLSQIFNFDISVSGLSPFAGECDVETMGNVTVGKYDFNDEAFDNVSPECLDFITKLLVKEQDNRMTAKQALRHKWVKRKPQYHPTKPTKPSNPLAFKAVYIDKVSSVRDKTIEGRKFIKFK
jgi:serine/threonine protein kinase